MYESPAPFIENRLTDGISKPSQVGKHFKEYLNLGILHITNDMDPLRYVKRLVPQLGARVK